MAALPPITRISREDLKEAPEWIEKILNPLNRFMESVYSAMNRQITFEDNITAQKARFVVRAGATPTDCTASFQVTMNKKPEMLIPGAIVKRGGVSAPLASAVYIDWQWDGIKTVNVLSVTGLTDGEVYDVIALLI